jgi:1,2-diacylglycerol 3-alpha-glucosyltransferase
MGLILGCSAHRLIRTLLRKKLGIPEDDIVLLSVGRLTHQKRPYTLIEVFSYLERELGNVTLCVAGKGELLEGTKSLAEKMGLQKVLFLGYVDDQDLPDLYACADYYIMTSKYEGGMPPLTLAEAMASGLPCIVSDIPNLALCQRCRLWELLISLTYQWH